MSFKRAGDDHCALRLQKKRRVTDLLSEDIPADEASQTRSGRFVCLVCCHNPVLDTMAMLVLHRQGKKHLANMAIKIEKEHDLSELLQKREQEKYLREATASTSISQDGHTVSEKTGPLLEQTRQLTEAIKKQIKLVNHNVKKTEPLESRRRNKPFFQSRVRINLTSKVGEEERTSVACNVQSSHEKCASQSSSILGHKVTNVAKETDVAKGTSMVVGTNRKELNKEQQRYLELKMSGWILDRSGAWVKDENVEFDSDEDDPPGPNTS